MFTIVSRNFGDKVVKRLLLAFVPTDSFEGWHTFYSVLIQCNDPSAGQRKVFEGKLRGGFFHVDPEETTEHSVHGNATSYISGNFNSQTGRRLFGFSRIFTLRACFADYASMSAMLLFFSYRRNKTSVLSFGKLTTLASTVFSKTTKRAVDFENFSNFLLHFNCFARMITHRG